MGKRLHLQIERDVAAYAIDFSMKGVQASTRRLDFDLPVMGPACYRLPLSRDLVLGAGDPAPAPEVPKQPDLAARRRIGNEVTVAVSRDGAEQSSRR